MTQSTLPDRQRPAAAAERPAALRPLDPRRGLQGFLVLDAVMRALIWATALGLTWACVRWLRLWPANFDPEGHPVRAFFDLVLTATAWLLLYNVVYVLVLVSQRVSIPTPKEGRYSLVPGKRPDMNILYSCMLAILSKARYYPPFPGVFVFNMSNIPPLVWLMGPVFGPRSKSAYVVDPVLLDPHLTTIGRNVTFGFGTIVAAHSQERDTIIIKRTTIGDDVLFGGNCIVYGGCTIGSGSVILGGAILQPDTVVGENELWGGLPARKIKDLPPYRHREESGAGMDEITK